MSLKERIESDYKIALREGRETEFRTLRMVLAALHNEAIAKRKKEAGLSEDEEVQLLRRELKRREEAAAEYERGGRIDLKEQEEKEAVFIRRYLPAEISQDALRSIIKEEIVGAANIGELMKRVMPKVKGQASGDRVRKISEELLNN